MIQKNASFTAYANEVFLCNGSITATLPNVSTMQNNDKLMFYNIGISPVTVSGSTTGGKVGLLKAQGDYLQIFVWNGVYYNL